MPQGLSGWWQLGVGPSSIPSISFLPGAPPFCPWQRPSSVSWKATLFQLDDVFQRYLGNDAQSIGESCPTSSSCNLLSGKIVPEAVQGAWGWRGRACKWHNHAPSLWLHPFEYVLGGELYLYPALYCGLCHHNPRPGVLISVLLS